MTEKRALKKRDCDGSMCERRERERERERELPVEAGGCIDKGVCML